MPPIPRDRELGARRPYRGKRVIVVRPLGNALNLSFTASIVRSLSRTTYSGTSKKEGLARNLSAVARSYELVKDLVPDDDEMEEAGIPADKQLVRSTARDRRGDHHARTTTALSGQPTAAFS